MRQTLGWPHRIHQLRGDHHRRSPGRSPRMVLYRHLDLQGKSEFEKNQSNPRRHSCTPSSRSASCEAYAEVDPEPPAIPTSRKGISALSAGMVSSSEKSTWDSFRHKKGHNKRVASLHMRLVSPSPHQADPQTAQLLSI